MALGNDGTVSIASKVDSKGFNAGIGSMMGALGKLAALIGTVFAVGKIIAFGSSAVNEASKMASALIGLQSVVEGTGNSMVGAEEFIKSFVADGLVPAGDAITAYKNLLLRGYDTSQVEATLTRLKDSAAFGRQGSLSMGEAIRGASEGLKNENSLLVDNAGVTKNVSKMWLDYAKSIGVAVTSLTKQDKILAEVQGIMEETRFQTGDAAKAAGTYAGQVSALTTAFTMMKVGLGNILMPILARIIPYIRAVVDALTVYFNRIAALVSLFFGVDISKGLAGAGAGMGEVAEGSSEAADAQDDLAENTKKAGKAAKGALASFDDLNVLAKESADGGGGGGDTAAAGGGGGGLPGLDPPKVDAALEAMKVRVAKFKEDLLKMLEPAIAAFKRLRTALEPLGKTLFAGLAWVWENILVPFGKWAITSFLPVFFDLLAAGARFLNAALIVVAPLLLWLWEHIFKNMAKGALVIILELMDQFTNNLETLAGWLEDHPDLFADIAAKAKVSWDFIKGLIFGAFSYFRAVWSMASWVFTTFVINPIRQAFITFAAWLLTIWTTTLNNLATFAQSPLNRVIGLLNGMLQGLASALNRIGDVLRNFRIDIPAIPLFGFPGLNFSAGNIPYVSAPSIPYLASGAVIPPNARFAAILGDQKSGTNIEAPTALIRQILQEELGQMRADISINFTGSLSALARELRPVIERETVRIGKSMVKGTS